MMMNCNPDCTSCDLVFRRWFCAHVANEVHDAGRGITMRGVTQEPVEDSVRAVRDYFDTVGAGEWDRLVLSPSARVALELHRRTAPAGRRSPGNR